MTILGSKFDFGISQKIWLLLYRRLGGVVGVSQPLTGKSFRFVRACDAKLCVSARRMRFRLLGLQTDLHSRRSRPSAFPGRLLVQKLHHSCTKSSFLVENVPTLIRNRRFCFNIKKCSHFCTESSFLVFHVVEMLPLLYGIVIFAKKCSHSFTESSFLFLGFSKMLPLLYGIIIFVKKCPHSFTESSFLIFYGFCNFSESRLAGPSFLGIMLSKIVPTPLRNRHFCCGVFPLSYGIVVFAPASKMCPLLHEIVVFFSKFSHSRTESSFLFFYIFWIFFSRVGFCYKNVTTPARNRHFFYE